MKRQLFLFVFVISLLLLILGSSKNLMEVFHANKDRFWLPFKSERYCYGDLYGMSYLSNFKLITKFNENDIPLEKHLKTRDLNLYIVGDSYLGSAFLRDDSLFCGVKKIYYVWNQQKVNYFNLAKGEKNILLIEVAERFLLHLADTNYILNSLRINQKLEVLTIHKENSTIIEKENSIISNAVYNENINQNLDYLLFDNRFFSFLKNLKADLNLCIFNRVAKGVRISPNHKQLFYEPTVDSTSASSSFIPIPNEQVDQLVGALNYIYDTYKSKGFDEVYFTAIPNPVTILAPKMGKYNNLIPRIQSHPKLKLPIIDVYDKFLSSKIQIYCKSDSHWNGNGFHIWVNEFNKKLISR